MKELIKSILKASPIALTKNHLYDKQTKKIIRKILKADSNCVDVGCHKGEILDLMLRAAPDGKHFGFEPIPTLFKALQEKYEYHKNCKLYDVALSNTEAEKVSFNYVVSNPSYSGLIKRAYDKADEKDEKIEVETNMLDHMIPIDVKIDLIKIDVEGGELLVLEGAKAIVNRDQPFVIFEHGLGASEFYNSSPDKIYHYFDEADMHISTLSDFLGQNDALTKVQFKEQFYQRKNYYFIAHRN